MRSAPTMASLATPTISMRSAGSALTGGPDAAGGTIAVASRPPSPSIGLSLSYFDGFCPEGATECSSVWEQLRWCTNWQQMRQVYNNLLRAEAEVVAAVHATASGASPFSSNSPANSIDAGVSGNSSNSWETAHSLDQPVLAPSATSIAMFATTSAATSSCAPGLLSRDETYAFLLQLQDFYHLELDEQEVEELQVREWGLEQVGFGKRPSHMTYKKFTEQVRKP